MNKLWNKYSFLQKNSDEFESELLNALNARQPMVNQAIRELAIAGGKRLRPALVLAAGQLGKKSTSQKLIFLAVAVEIMHMATLIHDDIVDEANLRRGVVTTQSKYGKDVAVFTGDYLFAQTFLILSGKIDPDLLKRVAKAIKYICEGEIDQYENRYNLDVSFLKYLRRIRRKTAILFQASCFTGSHLAKLPEKLQYAISKYGKYLGMIFQITDDILDVASTEETMGKPVGNDFSQGVYTLPVIYALQDEKIGAILRTELAKRVIDKNNVIRLIHSTEALSKTWQVVDLYAKKARYELQKFPSQQATKFMEELLEIVVTRNY